MHTGPLLLLVQANVAPEHERGFNTWYYQHAPTLLEIPGYQWGRRYINIVGETKSLALCDIAGTTEWSRSPREYAPSAHPGSGFPLTRCNIRPTLT